MKHAKKHPARQQSGFTLVEVLVTMVVVSVGLLGVAKLQAWSLKHSYATYQRSVASVQTQDLVERLWAGMCVLDVASQRSAIVAEWQREHANRPSTRLSMPDWSGSLVAVNGLYQITVQWTDHKTATAASGAVQTFSHVTSIPRVGCV